MLSVPREAWRRVSGWRAFQASLIPTGAPPGIPAGDAPARCRVYHLPGLTLQPGELILRESDRKAARILSPSRAAPEGSAVRLMFAEAALQGCRAAGEEAALAP